MQPADLEVPQTGCSRDVKPCLEWFGVRAQLRALASRQREGGWQALVVIAWTPEWAAAGAGGCERAGTPARARPPRVDALPAYRQLIADVLAAAEKEGATLRFWSPWNEPNHPGFISPQRGACDPATPSGAPAVYTELARTMKQTLDEAAGDQQLLLGETAGLLKPTRLVTSVPEFIAGLPSDLVCASPVWTQHAYVGGDDPVEATAAALAAHGCPQPHTLWITETGVGSAPRDLSAADAIPDPVAGLPRAPRPARPVVAGPARHRGVPVHGPRGRPLPDRPRHQRPDVHPPGARRVDRLGRSPRPGRPTTGPNLLNAT